MYRFILFLCLISLISCKTKQPVILDNPLLNEIDQKQISSIYVPIKLGKKDLEKAINTKLGEVIFEDDNLNNDSISVRATRLDSITLTLEDSTILYTVPLHIWVKKKVRFLGDAEAVGALVLQFATKYQLTEDWTIRTQTDIKNHEWVKTPKINVLGASIPVGAIADRVLMSSKDRITGEIDKLVKDGLSIEGYAAKIWEQIQKPILVSEEYRSNLKITPYGLAITPFKLVEDTIISTLYVQGFSEVGIGDVTGFKENAPLPPLKIKDFPAKPFQLRVLAQIPLQEVEKLALENIKGETYEFGKKKIKVEDIKLTKDGDKLAVEVDVSGDHNGQLFFKGIPSFDERNKRIDVKKVEFRLDTKNFLLKTAKWLFTDLIIDKLEGNLQYSIDKDLEEIKRQIQEQFTNYEIQPGINVSGNVDELEVIQVGMGDVNIEAVVELQGNVQVIAKDF